VEAIGYALGVFLNGAHVIGVQVGAAVATAVATIGLEIVLIGTGGLPGAIWAKVFAYTALTLLPYAFLLPRVLARMRAAQTPPIADS
jgi:hypothetical protein